MAPRQKQKLTGVDLWSLPCGLHHDGDGLNLLVKEARGYTSRSWIFRYTMYDEFARKYKDRNMGLGSLKDVDLTMARHRALAMNDRRKKINRSPKVIKRELDEEFESFVSGHFG